MVNDPLSDDGSSLIMLTLIGDILWACFFCDALRQYTPRASARVKRAIAANADTMTTAVRGNEDICCISISTVCISTVTLVGLMKDVLVCTSSELSVAFSGLLRLGPPLCSGLGLGLSVCFSEKLRGG